VEQHDPRGSAIAPLFAAILVLPFAIFALLFAVTYFQAFWILYVAFAICCVALIGLTIRGAVYGVLVGTRATQKRRNRLAWLALFATFAVAYVCVILSSDRLL